MGRKKAETSRAARKLKYGSLKLLWKKVPVTVWASIFQRVNPDGHWTVNGHSIKGKCPYHDDHTPSFVLNFDKTIGKCFGQCGKTVTDIVNFYAKLTGQPYTAALTDLAQELDIQSIIGEGFNELSEFNRTQEMKKQAAMAMRAVITEYIRDRPDYLDYLKPAIIYLSCGRKIPLNLLGDETLPIGIYAKPEHLKRYINPEYHSLFDSYFEPLNIIPEKSKVNPFWGNPCFHYNDLPGSISKFKLRINDPEALKRVQDCQITDDVPEELSRSLVSKNFYILNDPFISDLGVLGLHHYSRMIGAAEANAYATEGEFDALSVMVQQILLGRSDFMIFAFSGNGNSGLSFLRELGIRTLWLVQDSPAKKGGNVIIRILTDSQNFIGDAENRCLNYRIFHWSPDFRGGDLDEATHLMGYPAIVKYLFEDRSSNFQHVYNWVADQCDAGINRIKADNQAALARIGDADTIARNNKDTEYRESLVLEIQKWFKCLHTSTDKSSFLQRYSDSEGIDLTKVDDLNRSVYNIDYPEAAVAKIVDSLKEYITVLYYDNTDSTVGGSKYTYWSKLREQKFVLPSSTDNLCRTMSSCLGIEVRAWLKQLLAGSSLLEDTTQSDGKEKKNLMLVKKRNDTTMVDLLRDAVDQINPTAQPRESLVIVGQGIHYSNINLKGRKNDSVYFVNGSRVFKGTYVENSSTPVEWETLDSSIDAEILFKLDASRKWSTIDDISELYESAKIDLRSLYEEIRILLDGWRFTDHEVTRDYLAAWIMSLPIQSAINHVNITFVTGAASSGKTSFSRGLLGGNMTTTVFEVPTIVEGTCFTSDTTPAGVYQELNRSSITLVMDEAESRKNTEHSSRVDSVMDLLYSLSFGGSEMKRGGANPDSRTTYSLAMPVVMSAINMPSDPVFMSRVVPVYTQKEVGRTNLSTYIFQHFTESDITRIRKSITLCMLDKLPAICSRLATLAATLSKVETEIKVDDRFRKITMAALAVYDFMGFDAVDMYKKLVAKNKTLIESLNSTEYQSDVINAILYTQVIQVTLDSNERRLMSAKDCIFSGDIAALNNSAVGIYYIPERFWIVIAWHDVKYKILNKSPEHCRYDEASLRQAVSKNKYVVNITDDDLMFVKSFLSGHGQDIKNKANCTIVSASYLMERENDGDTVPLAMPVAEPLAVDVGPSESPQPVADGYAPAPVTDSQSEVAPTKASGADFTF